MKGHSKILLFFSLLGLVFSSFLPTVWAQNWRQLDQQARQRYQAARQQYLKEVNFYRSARQQFMTARDKFKKFKNRPELRSMYEEQARNFLKKTIAVLIKRLEAIKNWISNRPGIDEDERANIIAELDQDISWLKEQETKVDDATVEEIRADAREVRQYWRQHRWKVKRVVGQIWSARLDYALQRFEQAADKAEEKINALKDTGYDTSELENLLADFRAKLELARQKYEQAKEKYQQISSLEEADQLFREVRQFIQEANQYLREAHQRLGEIIEKMKQAKQE